MRILLALLLLIPTPAHAARITMDFSGGDVFGWYTIDTDTPGVRLTDRDAYGDPAPGPMHYAGAVTAFDVFVESVGRVMTAGTGNVWIDLEESLGETRYAVDLFDGPDYKLTINLWSPTGDRFIDSESLSVRPNTAMMSEGNVSELILRDEQRINVARHIWATTMTPRADTTEAAALTSIPRAVPEPSTLLYMGVGLASILVKRHRRAGSRTEVT